jgi:hypothetical protein
MTSFPVVFVNRTKKFLRLLVIVWMFLFAPMAHAREDRRNGPLQALREKYDELPNGAKVATAAVAGFVTSRVALKTFVNAAKVAGAAFIA